MKFPKCVIFDMDGLIFDSERAHMETKRAVMKGYGYELSEATYIRTLGLSRQDTGVLMRSVYGPDFPYEEVAHEARKRLNAIAARDSLPVKPGIPELLEQLHEDGIPACVASSSPRPTVDIYLQSSGLEKYFDFVISGDDITHSKPDPETFLCCCRHFGVQPEEALVLEDSENGILAAVNGKIPVLCIPDMKQPSEEIGRKTAAILPDAFAAARWIREKQ